MHRLIPADEPVMDDEERVVSVINCPFCAEPLDRDGHFECMTHDLKMGEDVIISAFLFICRFVNPNPRSTEELRRSSFFLIDDITVLPEALGEDAPKPNGYYTPGVALGP